MSSFVTVVSPLQIASGVSPDLPVFSHEDGLDLLHQALPLQDKLERLHDHVRQTLPFIDRIAVASYEPLTDNLKTFLHSSGGELPLSFYESKLSASHSLSEIASSRRPRVINDIDALPQEHSKEHSRRIRSSGYGASYTMPVSHNGALYGFLFFNSRQKWVFDTWALQHLNMLGHHLSLMVVNELACLRTLMASVRTVTQIAQIRDFETGAHLERMAHYSRIIAQEVAPRFKLDDAFIEYLYLFAPLHDIGKVAIPDSLLLKPGRLEPEEFVQIQQHTVKGRQIVESMLENFGIQGMQRSDMLRNIVLHHHEALDGSGYPHGLKEEEIPVEARIVAVADVFDALTSERPYKEAWSNQEAFNMLVEMAGRKFDHDCVDALLRNRCEVERIQTQFAEDCLG
ncbi:MAG TPA: HD domain-containing phosphohydrolase [Azospira sp.]|nr:HD domain-containing phosphohydrolase [Azospira sp.]